MAKATKMSIKIKGTPRGVKKALSQIVALPEEKPITYREADFRSQAKRKP